MYLIDKHEVGVSGIYIITALVVYVTNSRDRIRPGPYEAVSHLWSNTLDIYQDCSFELIAHVVMLLVRQSGSGIPGWAV